MFCFFWRDLPRPLFFLPGQAFERRGNRPENSPKNSESIHFFHELCFSLNMAIKKHMGRVFTERRYKMTEEDNKKKRFLGMGSNQRWKSSSLFCCSSYVSFWPNRRRRWSRWFHFLCRWFVFGFFFCNFSIDWWPFCSVPPPNLGARVSLLFSLLSLSFSSTVFTEFLIDCLLNTLHTHRSVYTCRRPTSSSCSSRAVDRVRSHRRRTPKWRR